MINWKNSKTLLFVNNTGPFIRESRSRVAPGSLQSIGGSGGYRILRTAD